MSEHKNFAKILRLALYFPLSSRGLEMWSNTDFRVWHSFSIIRLLVGSFDGWLVGLLAHPSIHPAVCPSLCLSELPAVHMFAWFVCLFIYPFMTLSFHILNYFCFFFIVPVAKRYLDIIMKVLFDYKYCFYFIACKSLDTNPDHLWRQKA